MPKYSTKATKRRGDDSDTDDAHENLQRFCDEHLDEEESDELAALIAAAYGDRDDEEDEDDEADDGGMTREFQRLGRGRDKEADDRHRGAKHGRRGRVGDLPPPFRGEPLPGGKMRAMDRWAADAEITRRDRGRRLGMRLCPGIEKIRCL